MYTLLASEQLTTDALVRNTPIGEDGARDGNGHFGVVRGFTDPPFVLAFPTYRGMTDLGVPSKPRMPWGYQWSTSSCASISVCLPIESPVAMPLRQPRMRSATVTVMGELEGESVCCRLTDCA